MSSRKPRPIAQAGGDNGSGFGVLLVGIAGAAALAYIISQQGGRRPAR